MRFPEKRIWSTQGLAVLGLILLSLLTSCRREKSVQDQTKKPSRPNLLLVTFDTTRADYIGCYGRSAASTPNIDSIAKRGVRFSSCRATAPLTLPSHASMLTGLYPFNHGLRDNRMGPLDDAVVTLTETLKEEGYKTGAVIAAYVLHSKFGLAQGFDHYEEDFGENAHDEDDDHTQRNAEAVTDAALTVLDAINDGPFFLWAHYFDPHNPYSAPGYKPTGDMREAYAAEIHYADRQLGRLLDRVRKMDEERNTETIIAFVADHGEALGDHGELTHALFIYEETIHVPFIIERPTHPSEHGQVVDQLVSITDLFPTVLDWLNLPLPYEIDGELLPWPDGSSARQKESRENCYFETQMPLSVHGWSPLESVIVGDDKYILAPRPELYNLRTDPAEAINLASSNPTRIQQLHATLEEIKTRKSNRPEFKLGRRLNDSETIKKLGDLGYASGVANNRVDDLPDAKDLVAWHIKVSRHLMMAGKERLEFGVETIEGLLQVDPQNRWAAATFGSSILHPKYQQRLMAAVSQAAQKLFEEGKGQDFVTMYAELLDSKSLLKFGKELLEQTIVKFPDASRINQLLGIAYLESGDFEKSVTQFEQTLLVNPTNIRVLIGKGRALIGQGAFQEAEKTLRLALREDKDNDNAEIHFELGNVLSKLNRIEEAATSYRKAIDLNEKQPDYCVKLAGLLNASGRTQEAMEYMETAIGLYKEELDQDDLLASPHYNLGVTLLQLGRLDEALPSLTKASELDPGNGDAQINLGICLARLGKNEQAITAFTKAITIKDSSPSAHYNLGIALAEIGQDQDALSHFEKAVELRPSDTRPIERAVGIHLARREVKDAIRLLSIGQRHAPNNPRILKTLADLLATSSEPALRDGQRALQLATQVCTLTDNQHPSALATKAAAFAEMGNFEQAVATAKFAIQLAEGGGHLDLARSIKNQLELYESAKPYRNPAY